MAPLAVAASWPALRRLDAGMGVRDADLEILRGVRMLGALPAATIEQLGAGLEHADFVPRQTVFEQGERGERFYIVESGRAEVVRDGRVVETLGRGNCFGEIALLRDQPRTATVRASADANMRVSVLQRTTYLTAVTGYPASSAAGEEVVTARLKADAERRPWVSVSGSGTTRASRAELVPQTPAEDGNGLADAPKRGGIRDRREGSGDVLDLRKVGAHGSDSLEVLRDLVYRVVGRRRAAAPVEVLGEKDVLGHLHRVLKQAMDEDHGHADELSPPLDLLDCDLADVRDELQLQLARLSATFAGAQVEFDEPPLHVEAAVHGDHGLGDGGEHRAAIQRVGLAREEGRVAFDLDQVEVAGRIDHFLEQALRGCFRVPEDGAVGLHVLRVAADVGDQEQRTPGLHAGDANRGGMDFRN
jgi:CRP-like cAMP-binding protein